MDVEDLRLAVFGSFASTGRAPDTAELAERFGVGVADVRDGLRRLAVERHLVLDDAGDIVMAHPFASVPLGFSVMGPSTLWWGGCAWDSFALPHLLPDVDAVLVATQCPGCGRAHAWNVTASQPPDGDQVAHFLVPAARMWDDVVHTCGNQRIFCSASCVHDWLARTGNDLGYIMSLTTLWRLASHWYEGRLDRGYVRREPAAAGEYLHSVGLTGEFWTGH